MLRFRPALTIQMKQHFCRTCLILVFLFGLHSASAETVNTSTTAVTLNWNRNSESNIAGYTVYYRQVSGGYRLLKSVTRPTATVEVRDGSTVYFAVTAFNFAGLESPFSREVRWP